MTTEELTVEFRVGDKFIFILELTGDLDRDRDILKSTSDMWLKDSDNIWVNQKGPYVATIMGIVQTMWHGYECE